MKFAIVDNHKVHSAKGAKGICSNCGFKLIAKRGEVKTNYWAHKENRNCDPWQENETDWQPSCKTNIPAAGWQEIPLPDERTSEKHIANIRSILGRSGWVLSGILNECRNGQ